MNKVIIIGRLTRDPDIRYTQGQESTCIARYTLAVDRPGKDKGADFISCVAFGKGGEFAEKYLRQGTKIAVVGRIQTGSYTNKNGQKVYTTDVVVESHEFCERMADNESQGAVIADSAPEFMQVPEGDDSLPFN
jgi:single-strand DNA-binding protein